jgi:hypothetical protein
MMVTRAVIAALPFIVLVSEIPQWVSNDAIVARATDRRHSLFPVPICGRPQIQILNIGLGLILAADMPHGCKSVARDSFEWRRNCGGI